MRCWAFPSETDPRHIGSSAFPESEGMACKCGNPPGENEHPPQPLGLLRLVSASPLSCLAATFNWDGFGGEASTSQTSLSFCAMTAKLANLINDQPAKTWAPAFLHNFRLSKFNPPSTSIKKSQFRLSTNSWRLAIRLIVVYWKIWPPVPHRNTHDDGPVEPGLCDKTIESFTHGI